MVVDDGHPAISMGVNVTTCPGTSSQNKTVPFQSCNQFSDRDVAQEPNKATAICHMVMATAGASIIWAVSSASLGRARPSSTRTSRYA